MRRIRSWASLAAAVVLLGPGLGPALAQTAADNRVVSGLRLSGNEPIQIESDKLEVKELENLALFTGNVTVTQGPTLLKSGRMTVFYAKDDGSATSGTSKIERLEVDGKVYVKSDNQVATGDRGVFDMKTEILVLTGKEVVLTEGANVLVGCKLTVQMKTSQAQVDGCAKGETGNPRVIMVITPDAAKN